MTSQTQSAPTLDFTVAAADLKTLAKCLSASLIESDDFLWRTENGALVTTFIDQGHLLARIAVPATNLPEGAEWGLNVGRFCDTVASLPNTGDIAVTRPPGSLETLRFVAGHAAAKMVCVDTRNISQPKVPALADATTIVEGVDADWLATAIKSCAKHSERIEFITSAGHFVVQSGERNNELSGIAHRHDAAIATGPDATSVYGEGFLTDIAKAVAGPLSIRFASDYPLIIETPRTLHMLGPIVEQS